MVKLIAKMFLLLSVIVFCTFSFTTPYTYAQSLSDAFTGAQGFIEAGGEKLPDAMNEQKIKEMSDIIYNVLLVIAIMVAVIIGIGIGIKFITGSVEQQAKVKETLIPYIAGCVVVFGAFTIWKIVVTLLQSTQ